MDKMSKGITTIAEGLIINGNLTGEGDMHIAGCIEGEIFLEKGRIVVEDKGYIEGDVRVHEITVSGEVRGSIFASSKVTISSTGKIRGDVKTARIDIAEGAFLFGNFEVEDSVPVSGSNKKTTA